MKNPLLVLMALALLAYAPVGATAQGYALALVQEKTAEAQLPQELGDDELALVQGEAAPLLLLLAGGALLLSGCSLDHYEREKVTYPDGTRVEKERRTKVRIDPSILPFLKRGR